MVCSAVKESGSYSMYESPIEGDRIRRARCITLSVRNNIKNGMAQKYKKYRTVARKAGHLKVIRLSTKAMIHDF